MRDVYAPDREIARIADRQGGVRDDSFVSDHSAGDAYGMRKSASGVVHVAVRGRNGRKRHAGIRPLPQVNCVIEGKVRDFSPAALNADRERDVELTLAGYA